MPSDPETAEILRVLHAQTTTFRSALALAVEDVRSALAAARRGMHEDEREVELELGRWARERVDAGRFAALFEQTEALDSEAAVHIEAAFRVLSRLSLRGDALFRVRVPTGASLRDAVASAYDTLGRAFGAARVVEAAKAGTYDEAEHGALLRGLRFRHWNEAERRLAPPLVVNVEGGDLFVSALAEFLDGNAKLVLDVRGDCPPAPLVRLVTPGIYVIQTTSAEGLAGLAGFDGPGIGAIVPEYAAHFTHDPSAGDALADRLRVGQVPVEAPRKRIGGYSAAQQRQDLDQLQALATRPAAPAPLPVLPSGANGAQPAPATAPDPADQLAAWLLEQAGLAGTE